MPDPEVRNLLYRRPELYEAVYHGSDHEVPRMCEQLAVRHRANPVDSILDIGCGTGRDLSYLSLRVPDCVGVDVQQQMIDYARTSNPGVDFRVADLRGLDLDRRFDLVLCLGFGINYLQTNADLERGVAAFALHSRRGSLLILETINSIGDPSGGNLPGEFAIETDGVRARAVATYAVDRRRQLLERRRVWDVPGEDPHEDYVRFRMIFPMELEAYLNRHGFEVVAVYDNTDLRDSDLSGPRLFFAAVQRGGDQPQS